MNINTISVIKHRRKIHKNFELFRKQQKSAISKSQKGLFICDIEAQLSPKKNIFSILKDNKYYFDMQ